MTTAHEHTGALLVDILSGMSEADPCRGADSESGDMVVLTPVDNDVDAYPVRCGPDAEAVVFRRDEGWTRLVGMVECTVCSGMELIINLGGAMGRAG